MNSTILRSYRRFKVSIERFPCIISQLESVTFLLLSHTGGRPRVTVTHSRRQRTPKGNAEWMKRWMNSFLWMNLLPPLRQGDRPISLPPLLLLFPLLFLYFLFFISVALLLIALTSRASINLSSELTYSLLPLPLQLLLGYGTMACLWCIFYRDPTLFFLFFLSLRILRLGSTFIWQLSISDTCFN